MKSNMRNRVCRSHHCATVLCYTMFPYDVVHLDYFSTGADRKSDRSRRLIGVDWTSAHQNTSLVMVAVDSAIQNSAGKTLSTILMDVEKKYYFFHIRDIR